MDLKSGCLSKGAAFFGRLLGIVFGRSLRIIFGKYFGIVFRCVPYSGIEAWDCWHLARYADWRMSLLSTSFVLSEDETGLEDSRESSLVVSTCPWLGPFLDAIWHISTKASGTMAYIAYQIWLFRNSLVFEAKVVPVHWVL